MKQWITNYIKAQKAAHDSIPAEAVEQFIEKVRLALKEDRQIFVFGNGGSAANASHFATFLGAYGVHRAVVEFAVARNWRFVWLAYEPSALYDVALERPPEGSAQFSG